MDTAITIFIAIALSWLITLSGVALGGWLVFRTKRESYEGSLFGSQPQGEAFNVTDGLDAIDSIKSGASLTPKSVDIDKATMEASERFLKQFEAQLTKGMN
jgi:hypothetical protein